MNQPSRVLSSVLLGCSMLVGSSLVTGCGKQQEASRQEGKAVSDAIKAPIDRAHDVERQQLQAAEEARKKTDEQTQ